MSLTPFQENTAAHAYDCITRKENARFLIADEVGLGKTIVAREIVKKFLENISEEKEEFTVVYICNNQLLAKKNLNKLKPSVKEWEFKTPHINRLSLLPLEKYCSRQSENPKQKTCYFYALTPGTSFTLTNGYGIAGERKLLYLLANDENADIQKETEEVKRRYGFVDSWKYWNFDSIDIKGIQQALAVEESSLLTQLKSKDDIPARRQALSRFGASLLKPDLVIFDEFQNYEQIFIHDKSLSVNGDEDAQEFKKEIDIINSVFAKLDPAPKYLLLSATPFAPLTMNEELARGVVNLSSCEAFCRLLSWLNNDSGNDFGKAWNDYADSFKEYCEDLKKSKEPDEELKVEVEKKRNAVQKKIRNVMSRTERPIEQLKKLVSGIDLKTSVLSLQDVTRKALFQGENELAEYEKYAYKPLSYMGPDYVTFNKNKSSNLFIDKIEDAMKAPYMQKLLETMGDRKRKLRSLFWMPPTRPTLKLEGAFKAAADDGYSKVLIFSQYRFIPRMISAGLSAQFEKDFDLGNFDKKVSEYEFTASAKKLLSPNLENCDCNKIFRSPAKSVYWAFMKLIGREPEEDIQERCRVWSVLIAWVLLRYMLNSHNIAYVKAVVRQKNKKIKKKKQKKNNEYYADYAADYCRMGCFGDVAYEYIYLLSKELQSDWSPEKIDAVGSQFFRTLRLRTNNLKLYINDKTKNREENFPENYSQNVRIHFADCFSEKEKSEQGQAEEKNSSWDTQLKTFSDILKEVLSWEGDLEKLLPKEFPDRNKELQSAFNSPFKPFVLSTTSIGQEGLDFHWYCRKIMHWNLPSNPVDFDQREGRINRFGSFALRQTLAAAYPQNEVEFNWDVFWDYWKGKSKETDAGLVPYWLPPEDVNGEKSRKIERIVPFYPLSREHLFMDDLLKMQAVYRMIIGQPHQDELLSLLRDLSQNAREEIMKCTISLQPPAEK